MAEERSDEVGGGSLTTDLLAPQSAAAPLTAPPLTSGGANRPAQAYALRHRIPEADTIDDDRHYEVHPEVSFQAMAGEPIGFGKRTWYGQMRRRELLEQEGIELPNDLDESVRPVSVYDVLDAAAAAWSAHRIAPCHAERLPNDNQDRRGVIWY